MFKVTSPFKLLKMDIEIKCGFSPQVSGTATKKNVSTLIGERVRRMEIKDYFILDSINMCSTN